MNHSETSIFSAILAFSVHEMKNSLSTISELIRTFKGQDQFNTSKDLGQLEFETNRVNNTLMQLLVLYKIEEGKFTPNIDEWMVSDILNDVLLQQARLVEIKGLELSISCPENLKCYCDGNLIGNAISTVVNNTQHYARKRVLLSANQEDGYVCISVEDDGEGYPKQFLNPDTLSGSAVNFNTGCTGLGLFFMSTIAGMHTNKAKKGFIKLNNDSPLGGAKFILLLP